LRYVVVVTGVPGTGKSTVAKLLADRIGAVCIDVSKTAVEMGFLEGWDEERGTGIADLEAISEYVSKVLSEHESVVVEGHYAHDVVPEEEATHVFVLRRHPVELREELESRGYPRGKVMENVEAEILDVCLVEALSRFGSDRVWELDVSGRKPEEVVEEMVRALRGESKPRSGVVDWIGVLESEGRLDEFLGG